MTRILVVEDDSAIAAGLVRGLRSAGFEVELAANGRVGLDAALTGAFDLVVLDLGLPEISGQAVLARLREFGSIPVIVLTARADLEDRIESFRLGADDYVAKPFWIEELVARIRNRLRIRADAPNRVVRFANAELDIDARDLWVDGALVRLTPQEMALLVHLVERPRRAIARNQLALVALPAESDRGTRTVDSHVARMRKKLSPSAAAHIATVWGIGYRFDPANGDDG